MLHFETLLKEEGKTINDLPKDLKQRTNGVNLLYSKALKNPSSASYKTSAEKSDLALCDDIQSWLDSSNTPPPASTPKGETEEEKKSKAEAAEKKAKDEEEANKKTAEEAKKAAENAKELEEKNKITELQNAIVTKMNDSPKRAIELADLTNILGRAPKQEETIGTLTIYKVYLTKYWKKK